MNTILIDEIKNGNIDSAIRNRRLYKDYEEFHKILVDNNITKYALYELPGVHRSGVENYDWFKSRFFAEGFDILKDATTVLDNNEDFYFEGNNKLFIGFRPMTLLNLAVNSGMTYLEAYEASVASRLAIKDRSYYYNFYDRYYESSAGTGNDHFFDKLISMVLWACLDKAIELNDGSINTYLERAKDNLIPLLIRSVEKNDLERMSLLLGAGANPNVRYYFRNKRREKYLLEYAIKSFNSDMVDLFIDRGAKVYGDELQYFCSIDINDYNYDNSHKIVKKLIESGADVNAMDGDDNYVLQTFVRMGDNDSVRCLYNDGKLSTDCILKAHNTVTEIIDGLDENNNEGLFYYGDIAKILEMTPEQRALMAELEGMDNSNNLSNYNTLVL